MLIKNSSYLPSLYIIGLLLLPVVCLSQDRLQPEEKTVTLSAGGGVMLANIRDEQFSSGLYSGGTPLAILNLGYQTIKHLQQASVSYSKGNLNNDQLNNYSLNFQIFSARYSYGRQVGTNNSTWENYVGASFAYLSNERKYSGFINKSSGGEKTLSLGLMAQSGYHFGAADQWTLLARLTLPCLYYVSLNDPGINELESGKAVFMPKLLIINTGVQLEREIGRNNALLLCYQWDAYKLDYQLAVSQASHKILLSYQIKF